MTYRKISKPGFPQEQIKIARTFISFKDGSFYWINKDKVLIDIEKLDDDYLFNCQEFLYNWAAEYRENRNLELEILNAEEDRRKKLKATPAGQLLYT